MRFLSLVLAYSALSLAPVAAAPGEAPVVDIHVHLWKSEESLRAYREQAMAAGRAVSGIGAMWFGGPNQAHAGDPDRIRAGNDGIIALAATHKDVIPIATVHPYDGAAALAEVERVAARGVKLLKIHPHTQQFVAADPRVLALVRRAGEVGLIVLMDNANIVPADSEKLFNLALATPKTRFIFAHMGALQFRFWNMLALARTAENLFGDNVYFDISASVIIAADSPIEEEFIWTMRNVGTDKLLLGSDYPQFSLAKTLDAFAKLDLTDAERAQIRDGNARRLLGLD